MPLFNVFPFLLTGKFTTLEEHRPKSHQRYLKWTPGRLVECARKTGPQCATLVEQILQNWRKRVICGMGEKIIVPFRR